MRRDGTGSSLVAPCLVRRQEAVSRYIPYRCRTSPSPKKERTGSYTRVKDEGTKSRSPPVAPRPYPHRASLPRAPPSLPPERASLLSAATRNATGAPPSGARLPPSGASGAQPPGRIQSRDPKNERRRASVDPRLPAAPPSRDPRKGAGALPAAALDQGRSAPSPQRTLDGGRPPPSLPHALVRRQLPPPRLLPRRQLPQRPDLHRLLSTFKWAAMSASTAAIPTANTNGSHALSLDSHSSQDVRRRTVVIAKKKGMPELLAEGGVSEDKIASKKDLIHTIRGESILDKVNHPSEAKKDVASAAVAERRKKSATKQEKPKWETALTVLVKLCLLISAITWMGQLFWRWQNGQLSFTAVDMDSRLSKVEGFKKTTKMLQVQLDILDKKLGNEIDKTKRDITKQFEEKGNKLQTKMKILEGKTEGLDKSLGELRDMGFVSKKEFEEILSQLKKRKGLDGTDNDISLDDIRLYAKEIVETEIARHAADGLGMVDYALGSGGAKVISHSEHFVSGKANIRSGVHAAAQKMLEPSFGQPGECFALKGSSGFVNIKLRTAIVPEAVTLEHVDKSVAYDRSSAPKDFKVHGWYEESKDDLIKGLNSMTTLGEFSYDLEKSSAQTFQLERNDDADSRIINMIRFDFSSNHGNSGHTCIYRLRVHGTEPASLDTALKP